MRFRKSVLGGLLACAGLSACAISEGPDQSLQAAANPIRALSCPAARLSNRPDLALAFAEAKSAACAVMESQEFRQEVEKERFARKCRGLFSKQRLLEGEQVYAALANGLPAEFKVTVQDLGRASAETIASDRTMAIAPYKIAEWQSSDRNDRAAVVNTLVHEMSHLVRESEDSIWPLFQDKGSSLPWCEQGRLASYGLGDIAEKIWKARHPA